VLKKVIRYSEAFKQQVVSELEDGHRAGVRLRAPEGREWKRVDTGVHPYKSLSTVGMSTVPGVRIMRMLIRALTFVD